MFRKIWQRLIQSGDPASSPDDDVRARPCEPSVFNTQRYVDETGASHYIDTPEKLVDFYLNNGDVCYRRGEYDKAISHFNEAISVISTTPYPGDKYITAALAYGRRGNAHFWTGNYDRAIEDYNKAIELEPDVFARAPLHVGRGKAYIREGENDNAIQDLDKAISLGVRSAEVHFDKGHAYTNRGEFGKAARDFSKANELDSEFVYTYMTGVYGVELDEHNKACSPYEIIGKIRENNIGLGVIEFISAIGSRWGFPKASVNSTLGMAAAGVSLYLAGADISPEQVRDVFSRRVRQSEYNGWAVAPYYREVYPMDTPDEKIIADMTDVLSRQIDDVAYEDFGVGITHGYPNDDHSRFGVCIVMGVGCTDGSAYALARINEARESVGVAPLEAHYSLRYLVRNYILMDESPDLEQFNRDMWESGYARPGILVRQGYGSSYRPTHRGVDALTYEDMGNLAAAGLLADNEEIVLRSDWQHIGIAARVVTHPIHGTCVHAEFVIAWQLPEGTERPAHFPPPLDESVSP